MAVTIRGSMQSLVDFPHSYIICLADARLYNWTESLFKYRGWPDLFPVCMLYTYLSDNSGNLMEVITSEFEHSASDLEIATDLKP